MKIINIKKAITADEIFAPLNTELNKRFHEQNDSQIDFTVLSHNGVVEITQPEKYGTLFTIEIVGQELHITRSEHYTDDVNSLTVESILYEIIGDIGDGAVDMVIEG